MQYQAASLVTSYIWFKYVTVQNFLTSVLFHARMESLRIRHPVGYLVSLTWQVICRNARKCLASHSYSWPIWTLATHWPHSTGQSIMFEWVQLIALTTCLTPLALALPFSIGSFIRKYKRAYKEVKQESLLTQSISSSAMYKTYPAHCTALTTYIDQ